MNYSTLHMIHKRHYILESYGPILKLQFMLTRKLNARAKNKVCSKMFGQHHILKQLRLGSPFYLAVYQNKPITLNAVATLT